MMIKSAALLLWAPRFAGLAIAVFLALFALDAFDGRPFFVALSGVLMHLLPALLVLAAVALAWRFPLAGGVAFAGLALASAIGGRGGPGLIAVIGPPLLRLGALVVVLRRPHQR